MNQYEDVRTIVDEVFKTPAFQDWLREVQAKAWSQGRTASTWKNPYRD